MFHSFTLACIFRFSALFEGLINSNTWLTWYYSDCSDPNGPFFCGATWGTCEGISADERKKIQDELQNTQVLPWLGLNHLGTPPSEKTSEENLTMVFGCCMFDSRLISHKCMVIWVDPHAPFRSIRSDPNLSFPMHGSRAKSCLRDRQDLPSFSDFT